MFSTAVCFSLIASSYSEGLLMSLTWTSFISHLNVSQRLWSLSFSWYVNWVLLDWKSFVSNLLQTICKAAFPVTLKVLRHYNQSTIYNTMVTTNAKRRKRIKYWYYLRIPQLSDKFQSPWTELPGHISESLEPWIDRIHPNWWWPHLCWDTEGHGRVNEHEIHTYRGQRSGYAGYAAMRIWRAVI